MSCNTQKNNPDGHLQKTANLFITNLPPNLAIKCHWKDCRKDLRTIAFSTHFLAYNSDLNIKAVQHFEFNSKKGFGAWGHTYSIVFIAMVYFSGISCPFGVKCEVIYSLNNYYH